jgi:hypothetical protein
MRARDIPLEALLEHAREKRTRLLPTGPSDVPRFRVTEANALAQLDAVVDWLARIPRTEWADQYLERHDRLPEER